MLEPKVVYKPLVYIRFYDHSSGTLNSVKPILCEIFGIVAKEDNLAYYLASWICDFNLADDNSDGYCILKSTVVHYEVLVGENGNVRANANGLNSSERKNTKGSTSKKKTK